MELFVERGDDRENVRQLAPRVLNARVFVRESYAVCCERRILDRCRPGVGGGVLAGLSILQIQPERRGDRPHGGLHHMTNVLAVHDRGNANVVANDNRCSGGQGLDGDDAKTLVGGRHHEDVKTCEEFDLVVAGNPGSELGSIAKQAPSLLASWRSSVASPRPAIASETRSSSWATASIRSATFFLTSRRPR